MIQPVVFQLHVRLLLFHCPLPKAGILGCSSSGVYLAEGCPEGRVAWEESHPPVQESCFFGERALCHSRAAWFWRGPCPAGKQAPTEPKGFSSKEPEQPWSHRSGAPFPSSPPFISPQPLFLSTLQYSLLPLLLTEGKSDELCPWETAFPVWCKVLISVPLKQELILIIHCHHSLESSKTAGVGFLHSSN